MRPTITGRFPLKRPDLLAAARIAVIPLAAAILGAIVGLAYSSAQSTLYESRSQVVVSPASGFLDPARSDAFATIATTVQELALTQRVLDDASVRLRGAGGPDRSTSWLRARLRLSISGDTPILTIAGVDGSQKLAAAISKAETDALVKAINDASKLTSAQTVATATGTTAKGAGSTTRTVTATPDGIGLQVFSESEDRGKVQPSTSRNILLGASAGFIIACFGVAQLLSRRTRRIPE